jgi:hypothetical protein
LRAAYLRWQRPQLRWMRLAGALLLVVGVTAHGLAADQGTTSTVSETSATSTSKGVGGAKEVGTNLSAAELATAQLWGISAQEMQRAVQLMRGPRGSFSVANISPLEVLGIHAKTDAERQKYAELFAQAYVADVNRSIAWAKVSQVEIKRITGNSPVVSFEGMSGVEATKAVAAGANVPRSVLASPAKSASGLRDAK